MPDNEKIIYKEGADQYDRLIAHEDYQSNLLPAIQDILSIDPVFLWKRYVRLPS